MSDETNNLGDDLKDKAKDVASDAKEGAKEFSEEAKETTNEFKEGWNQATSNGENKKLMAGLLAIFVGWLGVHKFVLGYQKEGIIMLVCGVVGWFLCGIPTMLVAVVALIEGIMYLTKSDEEFYQTYQVGKKPWF